MSRCGPSVTIVAQCQPDCPELPEIEFQNINLSGVGVLDSWDGETGNFRGVASANSMLTVTLDNVNHNALLTVVPAAIQAQFTTATESAAGILELATQAEVTAGTDDTTAVTPLKLATRLATTSLAGIIEIATLAEVQAGTATNLAVVPDTLGDMVFLSLANLANTTMASGASATVTMPGGALLTFGGDTSGTILIYQNTLQFTDAIMNFGNATIQIGGGAIPNCMVGAGAGGLAEQYPVVEFLSGYNIQPGYTNFTNPAVLRTCDTATVTLPQLAQIVGTLINDLKIVKLPAT